MDSLGSRHPQAINRLSNYLKLEAKDKKGVSEAGTAKGKFAAVCYPSSPRAKSDKQYRYLFSLIFVIVVFICYTSLRHL